LTYLDETFQTNLKSLVLVHDGTTYHPENSTIYCELERLSIKPFIALEHLKLRVIEIKTFFEMLPFVPNLKSLTIMHLINVDENYHDVFESTDDVKLWKLKELFVFVDITENGYVQNELFQSLITKMPNLERMRLYVIDRDIDDR
jgi:hypothetical protein